MSRVRLARPARPTMMLLVTAAALIVAEPPLAAQAADQPREARPLIERAMESRSKGHADAPVVVFEVADFQCPHCARFAATVGKELDRKYVQTGKVQWVFVNLPLHNHRLAFRAAKAALCAGAVGDAFWPMHDRLFAEQRRWSSMDDPGPFFLALTQEMGVPTPEFEACMHQDRVSPLILEDFGSAVSAGITGTPTFIIMRGDEVLERMVGVHSIEEWSRILDSL